MVVCYYCTTYALFVPQRSYVPYDSAQNPFIQKGWNNSR